MGSPLENHAGSQYRSRQPLWSRSDYGAREQLWSDNRAKGVAIGPRGPLRNQGSTGEEGSHYRARNALESQLGYIPLLKEPGTTRYPRRAQGATRELVGNYRESLGSCMQGMYGKSVCVCVGGGGGGGGGGGAGQWVQILDVCPGDI